MGCNFQTDNWKPYINSIQFTPKSVAIIISSVLSVICAIWETFICYVDTDLIAPKVSVLKQMKKKISRTTEPRYPPKKVHEMWLKASESRSKQTLCWDFFKTFVSEVKNEPPNNINCGCRLDFPFKEGAQEQTLSVVLKSGLHHEEVLKYFSLSASAFKTICNKNSSLRRRHII